MKNEKSFKLEQILFEAYILHFPFEDGITHPAEKLIQKMFKEDNFHTIEYLIQLWKKFNNNKKSDLLKIISRTSCKIILYNFVQDALKSDNIILRDSAIHALENFRNKNSLKILINHHEKVKWLQDYKNKIITEIKNEIACK